MKKQFLPLAIALSFCSCEKNDQKPIKPVVISKTFLSVAASGTSGPENSQNPYDSVGYLHNRMLMFINDKLGPSVQISPADICYWLSKDPYFTPDTMLLKRLPDQMIQAVVDERDSFATRILNSSYSQPAKNYCSTIFSLIGDTTSDYALFKSRMLLLERNVLNDRQIASEEQQMVLQCASIARYSGWYWKYKFIPPGNKSYSLKRILKWVAEVTADAGSAIAGAVGGGVDLPGVAAEAAADSAYMGWLVENTIPG
jgi:hypothetical protein